MNFHEAYIGGLAMIHIAIWLYVFFVWVIPNSKKHIWFILVVLLPAFYVCQSMPCHAIIYLKLKYIMAHKDSFKRVDDYELDAVERAVVTNISSSMAWATHDIEDAIMRLKYYENKMGLPVLIHRAREWLDGKTFVNPLNAHGLLIIAFIINTIALVCKYRIVPGAVCGRKPYARKK